MGDTTDDEPLGQGFLTDVVTRRGETVRRTAGPWSPTVHAWLSHLARQGLDVAPRPIDLEADTGIEVLSYVHGTVPSGDASSAFLWLDTTLRDIARLVRQFHDAADGFVPAADARWQSTAAAPSGGEVICHNDLAPWNTVFVKERPVAFIDWDLAAPGPRLWDVAYALWHFVPLYGDEASDPFPVDQFEPRAKRARVFCDAYGLGDRDGLVDTIVERQAGMRRMILEGAERGDPGLRRLHELGAPDGIQRQVDYVDQHRPLLDQALD